MAASYNISIALALSANHICTHHREVIAPRISTEDVKALTGALSLFTKLRERMSPSESGTSEGAKSELRVHYDAYLRREESMLLLLKRTK